MQEIKKPTINEVNYWLNKWNKESRYIEQEYAIQKLFNNLCPKNDNITDILIKCSTLNDFYNTNIFSIYAIAKHIFDLQIDERINKCDESLIYDIANIKIQGKKKFFYSFATKYCSHHIYQGFPIYDLNVKTALVYFKEKDSFFDFKQKDLKEYCKFKDIIDNFIDFYELSSFDYKSIDKYLWQIGKELNNQKN